MWFCKFFNSGCILSFTVIRLIQSTTARREAVRMIGAVRGGSSENEGDDEEGALKRREAVRRIGAVRRREAVRMREVVRRREVVTFLGRNF